MKSKFAGILIFAMARKRSGKKGKRSSWIGGNAVGSALLRLAVVMALFFLSRICFYLFNLNYFSGIPFWELMMIFIAGIRFDLSAVLILNSPFLFFNLLPFEFRYKKTYQGILNGYFYFINILGLMVNFIDTIYFRFTLKRLTGDIFMYLGVGGDFNKLIPQFLLDFWYVVLLLVVISILFVFITHKLRARSKARARTGWMYYVVNTLYFAVIGFLTVIGIRGGFQLRPISIITAGNYTSAKYVPLLLNSPFSIARTIGHESLPSESWFRKETDIARIFTPVHKGKMSGFRDFNVVIIIMESFSAEHIGAMNRNLENGNYRGYTPFLDSLIGEGLLFHGYANGKTSIQGIPAILSGIPSLMNESYIQSPYSSDRINSLAGLLKPKGYTSAFFHGGTNGTMGFDSYTRFAGFDHYYGRTEYNNEKDYDGKWGIRDEEFFQYTARTINQFPQPFLAAFFSLSSHHPYYVPTKYAGKFPKGKLTIQQSIGYSDYSLKRFFETARQMQWFDRTLFVITADHTSEGYYPFYQTTTGQYSVPILFYMYNSDLKGRSSEVAQQTDIMTSVLSYLGYDRDYVSFGTDLFDPSVQHFSVHYIGGLYGLIKDGWFLQFDGNHATALFNLRSDSLQRNNLVRTALPEKIKSELFIKAFIQQYNNRILENRLTAE